MTTPTQADAMAKISSLRGIMLRDFEEGSYGIQLLDEIRAYIEGHADTVNEGSAMITYLELMGFDHTMDNGDHVVAGHGLSMRHTSLGIIIKRIGDYLSDKIILNREDVPEGLEEADLWKRNFYSYHEFNEKFGKAPLDVLLEAAALVVKAKGEQ